MDLPRLISRNIQDNPARNPAAGSAGKFEIHRNGELMEWGSGVRAALLGTENFQGLILLLF